MSNAATDGARPAVENALRAAVRVRCGHFDQARQMGVVFHMMSALSEHGRVGLTAVGDSPSHVDAIYERAERILTDEAATAVASPALPLV